MRFYTHFPRQVGKFRSGVVKSVPELISYVNKWNGKRDLFTSVYGHEFIPKRYEPDFSGAIIDKIYSDLDPKDDLINPVDERTLRLSSTLSSDNIPHFLVATGTGFGVYALTSPFPVAPDRKKTVVKMIQEHYDDKAGGIVGDRSSYGDISRISRIPGTMNLKYRNGHRRYCVFVSPKSIENGTYHDRHVLTGDHGNGYVKGSSVIDLHYWEEESEDYVDSSGLGTYEDGMEEGEKLDTDWFCVKQAAERCINGVSRNSVNRVNTGTNRDRYVVLSYLYNTGHSSQQARGIVQKTFSHKILTEMLHEGQLRNVFSRGIRFPSKKTLQREGRCSNCNLCEEWQ